MTDNAIKTLVILGGNLSGWTAAFAIANAFQGSSLTIKVIEQPEEKNPLPWLLPSTVAFHQRMGIDERNLMRATNATFSLGTQYLNWNESGHDYFEPYGPHGSRIVLVDFHHFYTKAKQMGSKQKFEDYAFATSVAKAGKFMHPQNNQDSLLSTLVYSYNPEPEAYQNLLKSLALQMGVMSTKDEVKDINTDSETGNITSVVLERGETVEGDFFIDCSGEKALLLNKTLGVDNESWSQWLPTDQKLTYSTAQFGDLKPLTTLNRTANGFLRKMQTQKHEFSEFSYSSKILSQDQALKESGFNNEDKKASEPLFHSIVPGQSKKHWYKNCVAFGTASASFPSLEVSELLMVQENVMQFIELFPDLTYSPLLAFEYNRKVELKNNNLRDYLILHFLSSKTNDSNFWKNPEQSSIPESLQNKIALFKSHGKFPYMDEEIFLTRQWASACINLGISPQNYDQFLDAFDFNNISNGYKAMMEGIKETAAQMPFQRDYIEDGLS
jgi:tryptophan halogenase